VEKGSEPESKGSFKLPDQLGGGGAAAAKGGKAPPPGKDAKGKPGAVDDQDAAKREEAERAK